MYRVYVVTCAASGKQYVGCTGQPLEVRWSQHVRKALNGSTKLLHEKIVEFGPDAFTIDTLLECEDKDTARESEQWAIERLGTIEPGGYNRLEGMAGKRHSEESKQKMSRAKAGSIGNPGNKSNTGRVFSEEHKEKIRKSNVDTWSSAELRQKQSDNQVENELAKRIHAIESMLGISTEGDSDVTD